MLQKRALSGSKGSWAMGAVAKASLSWGKSVLACYECVIRLRGVLALKLLLVSRSPRGFCHWEQGLCWL